MGINTKKKEKKTGKNTKNAAMAILGLALAVFMGKKKAP